MSAAAPPGPRDNASLLEPGVGAVPRLAQWIARPAVLWALVFFAACLLYGLTAQRDVSWQDSGKYQLRVALGDVTGPPPLTLAHPLYVLGAMIFAAPVPGPTALAVNLFSGLGMAIALANLAGLLRLLTGRASIALLVAAPLAVAHAVWWLATIAEAYTWVLAGLTAELWILAAMLRSPRAWHPVVLGLVSGLGWSAHNLALLPLPIYFIVVVYLVWRGSLRARWVALGAAAWLVGAGLYLGLILAEAQAQGSVGAALHSALVGGFGGSLGNLGLIGPYTKANLAIASLSFINLLLPLAVVGWIHLRREVGRGLARALIAITVLEALFFVRYPVPDQFTFILPTLLMFAVAAGVGMKVLFERGGRWRRGIVVSTLVLLVAAPVAYRALPSALAAAGIQVRRARQVPFRDEVRYWLVPWKQDEESAARFAETALTEAAPRGVILCDTTLAYALVQLRDRDPRFAGVTVPLWPPRLPYYESDPAGFRAAVGDRPVYAVTPKAPYTSPRLLADAHLERPPGAILHRVVWSDGEAGTAGQEGAQPTL